MLFECRFHLVDSVLVPVEVVCPSFEMVKYDSILEQAKLEVRESACLRSSSWYTLKIGD